MSLFLDTIAIMSAILTFVICVAGILYIITLIGVRIEDRRMAKKWLARNARRTVR